jgi:formate dehydrogenase maturation protein FdhE
MSDWYRRESRAGARALYRRLEAACLAACESEADALELRSFLWARLPVAVIERLLAPLEGSPPPEPEAQAPLVCPVCSTPVQALTVSGGEDHPRVETHTARPCGCEVTVVRVDGRLVLGVPGGG